MKDGPIIRTAGRGRVRGRESSRNTHGRSPTDALHDRNIDVAAERDVTSSDEASDVLFIVGLWTTKGEPNEATMECVLNIAEKFLPLGKTIVYSTSQNINSSTTKLPNQVRMNEKFLTSEKKDDILNSLLQRLHLHSQWPLVISLPTAEIKEMDPLYWDERNDDKHSAYILVSKYYPGNKAATLLDIREQIKQLKTYSGWNSRACFLVVLVDVSSSESLEDMVKMILSDTWKSKLENVIVVSNGENENCGEVVSIHSWLPYQLPSGHCGTLIRPVIFDTFVYNANGGKFIQNINLFPEKIPRDFKACNIRVATSVKSPFVIIELKKGNKSYAERISGIEIRILQLISEVMNFSIDFVQVPENLHWGYRLDNGTWIGLQALLMHDETDIAIKAFKQTLNKRLLFEQSLSYMADNIVIFVPKALPYDRWLSLTRVFSVSTWYAIFIIIIIVGILMWYMVTANSKLCAHESSHYGDLIKCLIHTWCVVTSASVPEMPITTTLRCIFIFWVIFCFALSTVFQTFVTSYLANPGLQYQMNSLVEVLESDLPLYFDRFLNEYLSDDLQKIMIPRNKCRFTRKCFELSRSDACPKGSPFMKRMNQVLMRAIEAGFIDKTIDNILEMKPVTSGIVSLKDEYSPFKLSYLLSGFLCLFLGLGLSIVTFLIECVKVRPLKIN
ncbi:hypothetical protein ANN_20910 [Periplaneta americana]|uniref:Ionotropic glutamate receptor L-glutamate and glycine-binding domain-containing protein n=1 Tax=Periplaneta americana TaxID=6978 RepID=A0ABQ8SF68_PERAM|nr:hypothetical protein ANN_20910 [Periplaneta americana]